MVMVVVGILEIKLVVCVSVIELGVYVLMGVVVCWVICV